MKINKDEFTEYKLALEGHSPSSVWYVTPPEKYSEENFTFSQRKEFYLSLLKMLMENGCIKLGKHGQFLEGTIEEQINRYRAAFPKTEEEWVRRNEEIWFYEEDCPGGIVWIGDDGSEDWT